MHFSWLHDATGPPFFHLQSVSVIDTIVLIYFYVEVSKLK